MFLRQRGFEENMKKLTPVQRKICLLLNQGYSERKIARRLKKSRNTISDEKKQIKSIFLRKTESHCYPFSCYIYSRGPCGKKKG